MIPERLTERLKAIAEREGRTPEAVLEDLLNAYERDPIEDFIGAFDDDVRDLSVTVRETLRQKFAEPDDSAASDPASRETDDKARG